MTTGLAIRTDGPDWTRAIQLANLAPRTRKQYRRAVERYLDTGENLTDAEALATYAHALPTSSKAFLKAAIRLVTEGMKSEAKAQATPDNVGHVQAIVYRCEALTDAIKVKASKGERAHTWLTLAETKALLSAPSGNPNGTRTANIVAERDRLILALLVGAGLRREELVNLRFEDVTKQGERTVLDVQGKGAKNRVVPLSDRLARMIELWGEVLDFEGRVIRALGMNREPSESITGQAIFDVVKKYGAMSDKPNLQPHDLRRTFAQTGFDAGIPITQISKLLGHANVATTQRYLNLELDLETTASDFVPMPEWV